MTRSDVHTLQAVKLIYTEVHVVLKSCSFLYI